MIVAVILSAGESSRMGRPKALLTIDGETFIEHIVAALRRSGLERVVVVLGFNAEELRRKIEHLPVEIVLNPNFSQGQLSSLQVAIRHLEQDSDCDGILVHLVDHPYIDSTLVRNMIQKFAGGQKLIVVPRHHGKRGHPVIFARALFAELLNAPPELGAKAVLHAHQVDTLEIDTEDIGITIDIDTPELYRQHVKVD
jgi:molybdenum cofactor cytidylyltransferase